MNDALWTLIRLNNKAALRRSLRGVKTVRGALLLLFTLGLVALMIGPQVVSAYMMSGRPEMRAVSDRAADLAPLALFALTLLSTFSTAGEAAVFFTPAEVDFLFSAPFTRRELLVYKLVKTGQALVLISAFLALMMQMSLRWWPAGFVGLVLTLAMVQLVAMAATLAGQIVTEAAYTRARRLVLIAVGAVALAAMAESVRRAEARGFFDLLMSLRDSPVLRVVLAPFRVFASAIFAENLFPELIGWGAGALAIDAALVALVVRMDANYIEAAAAISQKLYERIRRTRQGGGVSMPVAGRAGRWRLPTFPWLAGVGPIAWRQTLVALRTSRHMLVMTAGMVAVAATGFAVSSRPAQAGAAATAFPSVALGLIFYLTFVFTMQLPWAFRGDLDHIDFLKTLPVGPARVAAGELAGGVLLLTATQVVLFAGLTAVSPASWPIMLAAAAFCGPFNAMLMATNNFLFLLYPMRHAGGTSFDFQMMGKATLFMFLQFVMLIPLAGVPAALGGVAYFLAGSSWGAFAITAWLVSLAELVPMVLAVAWAFQRFDVSTQTPA